MLRLRLLLLLGIPFDNFVYVASVCADKINCIPDSVYLENVNHHLGEHNIAPIEHRPTIVVGNGRIHQRMAADEIHYMITQGLGVVHTGARLGLVLVQLVAGNWQPGGRARLLFLELAIEGLLYGEQREGANGRTREAIV